jgi:DNA-binding beta-propeller fold protein YncE
MDRSTSATPGTTVSKNSPLTGSRSQPGGSMARPTSKTGSGVRAALAVDAEGNVYVADTGNKRIIIFDADGNYLTEFGTAGLDPGQFDEPVGVAVDEDGTVYVTDTWNQRIQTFEPSEDNGSSSPIANGTFWLVRAIAGKQTFHRCE